jgi:hypothetical protein
MDINWSTVWSAVGISLAANIGLSRVLLELSWKTMSDRMLANLTARNQQTLAGYQHELDKMIMVTKVHFETEFSALKTVFEKLSEVRLTMGTLRPTMGFTYEGETKFDKLKDLSERLKRFNVAYNALLETTENLRPFYPKDIYGSLEECRRTVYLELTQVMTSGDETFKSSWFQDGRKNMDEFLAAYNKVTDLIREHISRLAVAR